MRANEISIEFEFRWNGPQVSTLLDPLEFRWGQKWNFHRIWIRWVISLVKWAPGFRFPDTLSIHVTRDILGACATHPTCLNMSFWGRVVDGHTCRNKIIITSKQPHCVVWRNNDIIATMGLTLAWPMLFRIDGLVPWITVINCHQTIYGSMLPIYSSPQVNYRYLNKVSGKTAWQTSPQRPQYVTKCVVNISKKQQSMQFIYVYCVLLKQNPGTVGRGRRMLCVRANDIWKNNPKFV